MIAHVVLFKPKPSLSADERDTLVAALEHALTNIPLIKRAHVGRRITIGRPYENENAQQFPYAAILEFESEHALQEYLNHPAHQRLGEQFYYTSESALVLDFALIEGGKARELL